MKPMGHQLPPAPYILSQQLWDFEFENMEGDKGGMFMVCISVLGCHFSEPQNWKTQSYLAF